MSLDSPTNPNPQVEQVPNGNPLPEATKGAPPKTSLPLGSSRLPSGGRPARSSSRSRLLVAGTAAVALFALVPLGLWGRSLLFRTEVYRGPVYEVKKEKLHVTIVERGALEAAQNNDLTCQVKAGNKGSTVATTIRWVIDDGSEVDAGQEVCRLDDSGLNEQLKTQEITVHNAKADYIKAQEDYRIIESQNDSAIENAKINRDLTALDLEKYQKGDYEQARKDVEGRIKTAGSDWELQKDRASWSDRMFKKGMVSKSQAEGDRAREEALQIALQKVLEEKRVLDQYTKVRTETDLLSKKKEAERALERAKLEARAKLVQAEATRTAKQSVFEQEEKRRQEVVEEIKKCVIRAPIRGLVVYFVPEQARFGGGSQQSIVSQGEPVREGQKLMRIPDLSRMLINTRVHEAMVARLRNEDPDDPGGWQQAAIRVDAMPGRVFRGHVKSVATVASQQDFLQADVKVYQTMVSLDEHIEGLKPGMSAEVTIYADATPDKVLTIPVQSVVGTIGMGAERKCFVIDANGRPELRDIVIGMSNEKMVEVRSGLQEGEKVALNPRPLLGENSEMKPATSRSKNNDSDEGSGGVEGPKKGKKGKKGGPPSKGGPQGGPESGPGSPSVSPGNPMPPMGGPGAPKGGPVGAPSAQDREAMMQRFRNATPEQRRDMLNAVPETFRDGARQKLREQGLQIAN